MDLGLIQFSASLAVSYGKHTPERQQMFAQSTVLTLGLGELEERRCRQILCQPVLGSREEAEGDFLHRLRRLFLVYFQRDRLSALFYCPCLTFVPRLCLLRTNTTLLLKYLTSLHCAKKQVFVDAATGSCIPRACVPLSSCPVFTCCLSEAASPAE